MEFNKDISSNTVSIPKLPVVFLVDTSGSMRASVKKKPIEQINRFLNNIASPFSGSKYNSVDFAVIEFGSRAKVVREFAPITTFSGTRLEADGMTAMGEAICMAYEMLRSLRRRYIECGVAYYRPIVLMLTDGEATDDINQAAEIIFANSKKTSFWAAGIDGCNKEQLFKLTKNSLYVDINEIELKEFLCWLFSMLVGAYVAERQSIDGYSHLLPVGVYPIYDLIPQGLLDHDTPGSSQKLPPTPWNDWLD